MELPTGIKYRFFYLCEEFTGQVQGWVLMSIGEPGFGILEGPFLYRSYFGVSGVFSYKTIRYTTLLGFSGTDKDKGLESTVGSRNREEDLEVTRR